MNSFAISTRYKNTIIKIMQILLILFLFISPIYKCLNFISIFGYNIIIIIIFLLIITYLLAIPIYIKQKEIRFMSFIVLFVFLFEIIINIDLHYIPSLLGVFLFIFFLQTDSSINIECLIKSLLLSSILAAFFSVFYGLVDGNVTRSSAVLVDGSIAPIVVGIVLFAKKTTDVNKMYFLRFVSFISAFIVALFGMSRARIIIILLLIAIKVFLEMIKNFSIDKKISFIHIFSLLIFGLFIIFISNLKVFHNVIEAVLSRFSIGLESVGRDDEFKFALQLFKNNPLIGAGWKSMVFVNTDGSTVAYDNHNAYIAIIARGGILAGVVFLLPLIIVLFNLFRRKNHGLVMVLLLILLLLSYGNAGIFNYTVVSIVPIIVIMIKKGEKDEKNLIRFKAKY